MCTAVPQRGYPRSYRQNACRPIGCRTTDPPEALAGGGVAPEGVRACPASGSVPLPEKRRTAPADDERARSRAGRPVPSRSTRARRGDRRPSAARPCSGWCSRRPGRPVRRSKHSSIRATSGSSRAVDGLDPRRAVDVGDGGDPVAPLGGHVVDEEHVGRRDRPAAEDLRRPLGEHHRRHRAGTARGPSRCSSARGSPRSPGGPAATGGPARAGRTRCGPGTRRRSRCPPAPRRRRRRRRGAARRRSRRSSATPRSPRRSSRGRGPPRASARSGRPGRGRRTAPRPVPCRSRRPPAAPRRARTGPRRGSGCWPRS